MYRFKKHPCLFHRKINLFISVLAVLFLSASKSGAQDFKWTHDASVSGVEFYHSLSDCGGKKVVFLKFNNTTGKKVEVTWKEVFETQARSKQDGVYGEKKLILPAGETFTMDCGERKKRDCLILPSDVSPAYAVEIRKFEYKDITVISAP